MQYVKHGPDIPEALVQAHEDGRVVFFCGAGIAYPAGLPGFEGLVDQIYNELGTQRTDIEDQAYSKKQFDAALDLLERRITGQRLAVRTALAKVLKPKLRRKGAIDTHDALLTLARGRDDAIRLVTTNFDRIFHGLMKKAKPRINGYPAPLLPIPKKSRWNGVVYLHGLLPEENDDGALHRLVLTSGDFGLAYLTERWAARFVSELFRNYIVCFVGYSISDPVLRYMMDALAADRMLGENILQAFAFGDFRAGEAEQRQTEWGAKGVTPILYEVPAGTHDHSALHKTLKEWAKTYRDGTQAKERIVADYAMTRPMASTKQDDFVGRMLWAISQRTGLPAKRFADFDPVPSLDWLEHLCDDRYRQPDLVRFGVDPSPIEDEKLAFSLANRPSPYTHAPWMRMAHANDVGGKWDDVMFQMARWLVRHLDDPVLVLWITKRGGQLHSSFAWLIEQRLTELDRLEREGKTEELKRIRVNAMNAIPRPLMRTLWYLLLTSRVRSPRRSHDFYQWMNRFNRDGMTTPLRLELREMLTPRVSLREAFRWKEAINNSNDQMGLKDLINWEIALSIDQVHSSMLNLEKSEVWQTTLPLLLDDVQLLLGDALDLKRELGEADEHSDGAHWDLPSISPHWQNRGFRDWVMLIELLRDAWLAALKNDPSKAQRIAFDWFSKPYPTFKRLAFFAAAHDGVAGSGEWVDWFLVNDSWWLWSAETRREAIRLLVLQGPKIPTDARERLEISILNGPPRRMFRDDLTAMQWQDLVDHGIWLRLSKLKASGVELTGDSATELGRLISANPDWKFEGSEREEFTHWMSGSSDPDYQDRREIDRAPRKRRELIKWLQQPPSKFLFHEDDWRDVCRDNFPTAVTALYYLVQNDQWPVERLREALQVWAEEKLARRSWRYLAPLLKIVPQEILSEIASAATWWLEAVGKVLDRDEIVFIETCRRYLSLEYPVEIATDSPVTQALNHPIGHVTQALLDVWFRRQPEDDQGLPIDLKPLFTSMCDPTIDQYRHARVFLATHVIALFRVDVDWTTEYLLPFFSWTRSIIEATAAWEGFLWGPRMHLPLFAAFKNEFLDTANHYEKLKDYGTQYVSILTYAALDPADTFAVSELYGATNALPKRCLPEIVQALIYALEGAGDQRNEQWENRIKPYWQTIWPKSNNLASKEIAEQLARLAIAGQSVFPAVFATVRNWLQPVEHPDYVIHRLNDSQLCNQYPQDSLALLDVIIDDQPWISTELNSCLETIVKVWSSARSDRRYQRLAEVVRRQRV